MSALVRIKLKFFQIYHRLALCFTDLPSLLPLPNSRNLEWLKKETISR